MLSLSCPLLQAVRVNMEIAISRTAIPRKSVLRLFFFVPRHLSIIRLPVRVFIVESVLSTLLTTVYTECNYSTKKTAASSGKQPGKKVFFAVIGATVPKKPRPVLDF